MEKLDFQETCAFINGRYLRPSTFNGFTRKSPVDGRILPAIHSSSAREVDLAVEAAAASFERKSWRDLPLGKRKEILFRFARLIERNAKNLAIRDTWSMGKPIRQCLENDIPLAVQCIEWYAESIDKVYGQCIPPHPNIIGTIEREPLGVVAAITPWNFPMENVAWKIAPALAAGNSLVLKPAEQSTFSALYLGQLANEAGIPDGVLNIVPGRGETTGKALALHPAVNGVFFTGSTAVGKKVMQFAAQSNMKRVALECGGKSSFIVTKNVSKITTAARALADGLFKNQGQVCSAPSRLIVEKQVHDDVLEALLEIVPNYQPRNPLDESATIGAMVDHSHLDRVLDYVQMGKKAGAKLLVGGKRTEPVKGGAYMMPTVFDGVKNSMRIAREEIFGPVLSVITVNDAAQAVQVANDSLYGLASAVWSDDIDEAHQMARSLHTGTVHINSYGEDDLTAPFGGFNQSGNGSKEKSLQALDAYSQVKLTWLKLEGPSGRRK